MGDLWTERLVRWLRDDEHNPGDYWGPLGAGLLLLAAAAVAAVL